MLFDRCPVLSVCDVRHVRALWPNGWWVFSWNSIAQNKRDENYLTAHSVDMHFHVHRLHINI